jgi:Protein of unknown function (DUF2934)
MQNLEQAIRERAYHLWIADGSPDGNSDDYWLNAQREILTTSIDSSVSEHALLADKDSTSITTKPDKKTRIARPRKSKLRAA